MQFINKTILYLICFMPPALVAGPFIADGFVVIINILFIYIILKKKNFTYFKSSFFKFFSVFYLILILSSLNSNDVLFSLKSSIPYFRHGIFALAIIYMVDEEKENFLKKFFIILCITFTILTFDGLFQYFSGKNIFGLHHPHPDRITSFFVEELKLGSYLARMMPILIAFLIYYAVHNKSYIVLAVSLVILVDILVYISMERAAFFLTMLSMIYIIFFSKKYKLIRFICFIFSIIIIVAITLSNDALKTRMVSHPITAITDTLEKKFILTAVHDSIIKSSIKMFKDNMFLGIGPKMYRKDCSNKKYYIDENTCDAHPHNTYLQLLAETGLLGFSLFSIFVLYFIYKTFYQFKNLIFEPKNCLPDFSICVMASVFINIWPIIPTGNFFNNWLSIVYYIPLGFMFSKISEKNTNNV